MSPEPTKPKPASLRFAVMCNGTVFQQWQAEAIEELEKHGHHLVLMIRDGRKVDELGLIRRILKKKWKSFLFTFLENRVFKPGAKKQVDLQRELGDIDTLDCLVEKKGYSEYFSSADVAVINGYHLDFILRFGFNIIRGDILGAACYGVWSFHHDDEMKYRGGPPGFWEIFYGDPVNGAILQKLTNKLDAGIILKKGYLKTVMHSYRGNLDQLLTVTSSWPAQVADELMHDPAGVDSPVETNAPVFKVPGNIRMMRFLFKLLRNRARFYYYDLLAAEEWNIGLIRKPIHEVALRNEKLNRIEISWLPEKGHTGYLADPSGFIENGKLHILAEDYSYELQRGGISQIIWDNHPDGVTPPCQGHPTLSGSPYPVRVLEGENHLSYPYIMEYQGIVYCIPESHQSSNITLYRREGDKFVQDHILLSGIEAVDPTLILHEGSWWLFFTLRKYSNSHLVLYYATELTGEYKPHRLNPVKIDIRSARPAGTPFVLNGVLYRPAQDCSGTYGGRVVINQVLQLTPDEFAEQPVSFIDPVRGCLFDKGLHTLSAVGNDTLIDGKRYRIDFFLFMSQLRRKLGKKR